LKEEDELNREERLEFLNELSIQGIFFTFASGVQNYPVSTTGGYQRLSPEKVLEYMDDPDLFEDKWCAEYYGVSLEQFIRWRDTLRADPYCRAMVGTGRRKRRCRNYAIDPGPADFNPDIDLYCSRHGRL
jgi:hypothetical protein